MMEIIVCNAAAPVHRNVPAVGCRSASPIGRAARDLESKTYPPKVLSVPKGLRADACELNTPPTYTSGLRIKVWIVVTRSKLPPNNMATGLARLALDLALATHPLIHNLSPL